MKWCWAGGLTTLLWWGIPVGSAFTEGIWVGMLEFPAESEEAGQAGPGSKRLGGSKEIQEEGSEGRVSGKDTQGLWVSSSADGGSTRGMESV